MRLIPLHNALLTLSKLLPAKAAAIKLVPQAGATWLPVDVAVGETAELAHLGWQEGGQEPALHGGVSKSIFGIPNVHLYDAGNGCVAWQIDVTDDLLNAMPGQFKFSERRSMAQDSLGSLWIGLALDDTSVLSQLDYREENSVAELLLGVGTQALWGLYQSLQTHADPITGLPGAVEFRARLQRALRHSSAVGEGGKGVALLLLGIDDYVQRRRQVGQEHAERLVGMAAPLLEAALRMEDDLYSYRDAHFAVVARVQDEQACERVAQKLLGAFAALTDLPEYSGTSASIGYVFAEQSAGREETDLHVLCLSAEQALDHAYSMGGSQIVSFNGAFDSDEYTRTGSLGSILNDPAREQRNNRILWQTVSLIAAESEPEGLCRAFTDLLESGLDAHNVLLVDERNEQIQLLVDATAPITELLNAEQQRFLRRVLRTERTQIHTDRELDSHWLATPLVSRSKVYGCLFLDNRKPLDAADQVFFKALADQIAGALDRAELARREITRSQEETQELRAQLTDLRQNMQRPVLPQVANSKSMRDTLDYVYRIAPTDVSVLIMGESGAGKEVMARTIHEFGSRSSAPLVVVDCGAITHSLIDSELFGRVKGAFTGADEASVGRMAQAQGGTLFLDEIGELPLNVQSKLLRFVQEKEVIAVGGTEPQYIDARIICATNRDLAAEVEAGRFRADLYYRLQVIEVRVPPLRERGEDLPQLVDFFLKRFSAQFDRELTGLTDAAWDKVKAHGWPGNIRELQNTFLRAALVARDSLIDADDLQLGNDIEPGVAHVREMPPAAAALPAVSTPADPSSARLGQDRDDWAVLASLLQGQLVALRAERVPAPIGRWLNDTLVLAALEFGGGVVRTAARLLGVPETTLRRQLAKAQQNQVNPLHVTSAKWLTSQRALHEVLCSIMTGEQEGCLADEVEAVLLKEIVAAVGDDDRSGAALMGVTAPTYRRRLDKYNLEPQFIDPALLAVGR